MKMYTLKEVAEKTGVTMQSVRNWIKSGKLKAEKRQKGLRYYYEVSESDLSEFIKKQKL